MSGKVNHSGAVSGVVGKKVEGWTLITSLTASGTASSIAFSDFFSSDYTIYKLFGYEMYNANDNTVIYGKFRNTSGDLTTGAYRHLTGAMYTNSTTFYRQDSTSVRGWTDGQFRFQWNSLDNTAGYSMDMEMTIIDPLRAGRYPMASWMSWHNVYDLTLIVVNHGMAQFTNTDSPITGISFHSSGGNINGKFLLYGLKN